ncbi:YdcF family protein [Cytophagaceae bacterium YF14B1]|uniref:YdcF family protein n=1 Tax=Xanthocytophaga flava TaxID=3048013 RepID=A0AAE3QTV4_9BACT|nr:YdcF family protein [Xanthocytophaga flavus]MDJ1485367.1 YdcF family protein [Xanthocytophaga flavus]
MSLDSHTLSLAKRIWDYHHVHHTIQPADCILVLGSHDTRVAERGAQLLLDGYAPLLVFSGGLGRLTEGLWADSEAEIFSRIAIDMGVPPEKILTESRSRNTGENISLTYALLRHHKIDVKSLILVQKPYMERRAYATFQKQWPGPEIDIRVTSPQIAFEDYATPEIQLEDVIHIMIGDLQRIQLYPKKGFQSYQDIPEDILDAYHQLVEMGFDEHLIYEK